MPPAQGIPGGDGAIAAEVNLVPATAIMPTIYLAAPLFTAAERAFNIALAARLRAGLPAWTVAVPQEFCAPHEGDFGALYRACRTNLEDSDVVVAVLDGADPDSGTSWECGFACARGIPVIGLRTDLRPGEDGGLPNCMLSRSCACVVRGLDAVVAAVAATAVRPATPPPPGR